MLAKEERMCPTCLEECKDDNRCIRCGKPIEDKNSWKNPDFTDEMWYQKAYGDNWKAIMDGKELPSKEQVGDMDIEDLLDLMEEEDEQEELVITDENGNPIQFINEDDLDDDFDIDEINNEEFPEDDGDGSAFDEFDYEKDESYEEVSPNDLNTIESYDQ